MHNIDIRYDALNEEKQQEVKVKQRNWITESYNPYDIEFQRVSPKVELHESVKISFNLPDLMFSNMIPTLEQTAIDPLVEIGFNKLQSDPSILLNNCNPVDYRGKNKDRIKNILCKYVGTPTFDEFSDYFRKSDLISNLAGKRGCFRVVCLYIIEPKTHRRQRHSKHILRAILLDPYHLFLPSKLGEKSAEEMKIETYKKVSKFSVHIGEMIKE